MDDDEKHVWTESNPEYSFGRINSRALYHYITPLPPTPQELEAARQRTNEQRRLRDSLIGKTLVAMHEEDGIVRLSFSDGIELFITGEDVDTYLEETK